MARKKIALTRPKDSAIETVEILSACEGGSFQPSDFLIEPMLRIEYLSPEWPDLSHYDAVIVTSAQAVPSLRQNVSSAMPLYVVGEKTAQRARAANFGTIRHVSATVRGLLEAIKTEAAASRLLYLRGADVSFDVAAALAPKTSVDELIIYKAHATERLSEGFVCALHEGGIAAICFFSRRTARIFIDLIRQNALEAPLKLVTILCMSQGVSKCFETISCAQMYVSETPDMTGMKDLIAKVNL